MNCPKCGTENPEGAIYCMSCGERVDGKRVCPACKTPNPAEARFCIICGKRIDGKRECPSCHTINDEVAAFCLQCGTPLSPSKQKESSLGEPSQGKALKALSLSGNICLLVAAFLSLVFVFCIGVAVTGRSSEIAIGGKNAFLYEYFGGVYKTASATLKAIPQDTQFLALSLYLPDVLGTVVSAGALVCVPLCLVLTAVRFARFLQKKEKNTNFAPTAVAAVCVYLFAVCAIVALSATSASMTTTNETGTVTETIHAAVGPNKVSLAGVIVVGIFLLAGLALRYSSKGKEAVSPRALTSSILSAVGIVFTVLTLVFASMGGLSTETMTATESVSSTEAIEGTSVSMTFPLSSLMNQIGLLFFYDTTIAEPVGPTVTFILASFVQLGMLACAALLLMKLGGTEERSPLGLGIALLACTLLNIAMTVAFGALSSSYLASSTSIYGGEISLAYTNVIVATVFGALLSGIAIAKAVLHKKSKTETQID